MGEFRAELTHELIVDVVDRGEVKGMHSGVAEMLRCAAGLCCGTG